MKVANELDFAFYDQNFINLAAKESGISLHKLEDADERVTNPWLFEGLYEKDQTMGWGLPASDALFQLQSKIILEAAQKQDCVVVGRCGAYVLAQAGIPCLSLFIDAPFEKRVERKMAQQHWEEKEAVSQVRKADKRRRAYYEYYTDGHWGEPAAYDLCLNSAWVGMDATAELICRLQRDWAAKSL